MWTIFGIPVVEVTGMENPTFVASDWASYVILRDKETDEIFDLDSLRRECIHLLVEKEGAICQHQGQENQKKILSHAASLSS